MISEEHRDKLLNRLKNVIGMNAGNNILLTALINILIDKGIITDKILDDKIREEVLIYNNKLKEIFNQE
jgi:hypothetical protein